LPFNFVIQSTFIKINFNKNKKRDKIMNSNEFFKSLFVPAIATIVLLLIPFLAMQFNADGVDWNLFDFFVAGALLFGTGSAYKLITRKAGSLFYKIAAGIALASGLFLVWANLAVGIIGSEENPINVLYFGVIAIGLAGAGIARFRSSGLAYTMFTMAGAIVLIAAGLLIFGGLRNDELPGTGLIGLLGFHAFFVALFIISALLFQRASQEPVSAKI
jgi:hypothetical protein